jgi:hypothetical protein
VTEETQDDDGITCDCAGRAREDPGAAYGRALAEYGPEDRARLAGPWFGQFASQPHDPAMDSHPQWCWRHWAPCPVLGANGVKASVMVISEVFALYPSDQAREVLLDPAGGRLCCRLGDEAMYRIWGQCPPAPGKAEP